MLRAHCSSPNIPHKRLYLFKKEKKKAWNAYSELICVSAFIKTSRSNGSLVPISTLHNFEQVQTMKKMRQETRELLNEYHIRAKLS